MNRTHCMPSAHDERYDLIGDLNRTELLQVLKELGITAHPGAPLELLQETLLDRIPLEGCGADVNPIDSLRVALIDFISDHWMQLRPQIKCPAQHLKTTNPRPCFGCTDLKVLFCVHSQNPRAIQLITEKRK